MKNLDRIMTKFSKWFASSAGVIQTFVVVMAWVFFEQCNPTLDPNGFMFLYILTIYSSVTQPILAFSSELAARKFEKAIELLLSHDEKIEKLIEVNNTLLDTILAQDKKETVETDKDFADLHKKLDLIMESIKNKD